MTVEDGLPTRVGRAVAGDNLFFGHSVRDEIAGRLGYLELLALAFTGRRLAPEALDVLGDITSVSMAADPHIWPLKLTRVVAAYGGGLSGLAASMVSAENARIGAWMTGDAARFLIEVAAASANGEDGVALEEAMAIRLAQRRPIPGFGVPFRDEDERLTALRACLVRRGRATSPFWRLLEPIGAIMRRARGLEPNIGIGAAAAFLDVGLTPKEIPWAMMMVVHPAQVANAVEGAEQAPAVLQRLPDRSVRYLGPAARTSPRAIDYFHAGP